MARGKPGADQLELSRDLLDVLDSKSDCRTESGIDCRNYGELLGIPEARQLFASYMGVAPEETIVVGSASLTFMYDCMARAMQSYMKVRDAEPTTIVSSGATPI